MRGNAFPFSRLQAARALVAGAAVLVGAVSSIAGSWAQNNPDTADEVALALLRGPSPNGVRAELPRPLPPGDAARLRRVFDLQGRGRMEEAARETAALAAFPLLGHVLADRFRRQAKAAGTVELASWLSRYGDQPDAPAIRARLARRLPPGAELPSATPLDPLPPAANENTPEDSDPGERVMARHPLLDRTVAERAADGQAASALRLIGATRGLRPAYAAMLRAEIAQILFTRNQDAEALEIAGAAFRHAPPNEQVALAGFVAGLAAWRLDRADLALPYFEGAARAAYAPASIRAASAFWAARAHLHTGDPGGFEPWMRQAAKEPRTLHGLLARRMLGIGGGFAWTRATLGVAEVQAVAAMPGGSRAFALLEIGQSDRAEAELRLLWPAAKEDGALRNALLLVAREAGFTDLAAQIAARVQAADGKPRDFDRFPLPRLRPRGGFSVDPPLVYALTRLESNFDPEAVSPVGARGLMQLMPDTADYVAGEAVSDARLHDPAVNLELGQRYVNHLAGLDVVEGDLLRLLASYNSGPGNFARWGSAIRDRGDPLLFIEAIPVPETRAFVEHALTYSWIYAARLRLPAPSLDQMAAGAFPSFTPPGKAETVAAAAPRTR